jgi:hypothetical protein
MILVPPVRFELTPHGLKVRCIDRCATGAMTSPRPETDSQSGGVYGFIVSHEPAVSRAEGGSEHRAIAGDPDLDSTDCGGDGGASEETLRATADDAGRGTGLGGPDLGIALGHQIPFGWVSDAGGSD